MTVYKISDWKNVVEMKVSIDWNHPETEKFVKDTSMFWPGHPNRNDDIAKHIEFLFENIANDAYCLSRRNNIGFSPDKINELVLERECYSGSQQNFFKIYDFVDKTEPMVWRIEEMGCA